MWWRHVLGINVGVGGRIREGRLIGGTVVDVLLWRWWRVWVVDVSEGCLGFWDCWHHRCGIGGFECKRVWCSEGVSAEWWMRPVVVQVEVHKRTLWVSGHGDNVTKAEVLGLAQAKLWLNGVSRGRSRRRRGGGSDNNGVLVRLTRNRAL